jgi:hypothetical protein
MISRLSIFRVSTVGVKMSKPQILVYAFLAALALTTIGLQHIPSMINPTMSNAENPMIRHVPEWVYGHDVYWWRI